MPVFDIDILDGEAAAVVENIVRDFLANRGEILVRIGMAPRRAIPLGMIHRSRKSSFD